MPNAQHAVWRNGGSTPQTILWEIERYYSAVALVKPPLRQAAGTLHASGDSAVDNDLIN